MFLSKTIIFLMAIFAVLGGIDRIVGNKFGLGAEFEEGFNAIGSLALAMIGINCLSPLIAQLVTFIFAPVFSFIGADISIASSIFVSVDTGGYYLAKEIASSSQIADFSSIIIGSMLAPTIMFSIPIGLNMIDKKDTPSLAIGSICGLASIPFGSLLGGLLIGLSFRVVMINLLPVCLVSALVSLCLLYAPEKTIKAFTIFARFIVAIITTGLILAIFQELTGVVFVNGLAPLSESFEILGDIAIVLAGAYPCIFVVNKLFATHLQVLANKLNISPIAVSGFIATLANSIPMMASLKKMDTRGQTYNFAFASGAAFVFGDHLGFCAAASPQSIAPMIFAKLFTGILAVVITYFMYNKFFQIQKPRAIK